MQVRPERPVRHGDALDPQILSYARQYSSAYRLAAEKKAENIKYQGGALFLLIIRFPQDFFEEKRA